jgi:hypothetical protein
VDVAVANLPHIRYYLSSPWVHSPKIEKESKKNSDVSLSRNEIIPNEIISNDRNPKNPYTISTLEGWVAEWYTGAMHSEENWLQGPTL